MTSVTEPAKSPPSQPYPAGTYAPFAGAYPPGAYPPPFYTYAPPPTDSNGENAGHHAPYMMPYPPPPGMVYAYPPPPQGFYQGETNGKQNKRKQVKMACTNCAAACKRCDEARPCERCIKYGFADQCQDGQRKERKKGIKRGPYKRKNKSSGSNGPSSDPVPAFGSFIQHALPHAVHSNGDGPPAVEWHPHSQSSASPAPGPASASSSASAPAASTSATPAAHAMPQYGPPPGPEGFYPYYYPPPHGFMPPPHGPGPEGHAEGSAVQHQPPGAVVQFFSVHPGGFGPFSHYSPYPPPPHPSHQHPPQHPHQQPQQNHSQQQTIDPKIANSAHRQESEEEPEEEEEESSPIPVPPTQVPAQGQLMLVPVPVPVSAVPTNHNPNPAASTKKRGRAARNSAAGEPKAKKAKTGRKGGKRGTDA